MISITISGLDKVLARFPQTQERLKNGLDSALKTSIMMVEAESKKNAPVNTGNLRKSHKVTFGYLKASLTPTAEYSLYVHQGTRPHFPPIEPIERWAQRKLGKKGLGYVIARKIAQRGTKPQPFLQKAVDTVRQDVVDTFVSAIRKAINF